MQFFDDSIVWVTDTDEKESMRTVSWNRKDNRIDVGDQIMPAPGYYALNLSGREGIVTLAEQETSVWSINSKHEVHKLFEWTVQKESIGPNPSVRTPRGEIWGSKSTYLSPLRTTEEDAAIYQIPLSLLQP